MRDKIEKMELTQQRGVVESPKVRQAQFLKNLCAAPERQTKKKRSKINKGGETPSASDIRKFMVQGPITENETLSLLK